MTSLPPSETPERETYTVFVRNERFVLSRSQITFDSPNHFTDAFLGEFAEAITRTMHLDSNPELFAIIVDYLSGYEVLPIEPGQLPRTMSAERARRNLAKDADYLGLKRLLAQLEAPLLPSHLDSHIGMALKLVELEDVLEDRLPPQVNWGSGVESGLFVENGLHVLVRATKTAVHLGIIYSEALPRPDPEAFGACASSSWFPDWFHICHDPNSNANRPSLFGPIEQYSQITIDGFGPVSAHIAFSSYRKEVWATDARVYDCVRESTNLWAEEVIFTIRQRGTASSNGIEYPFWRVGLVRLYARSRRSLIDSAVHLKT